MAERSFPALFAAGLRVTALALAILGIHRPAFAQSADLVLCDRVAADPFDPDKPAYVKGTENIAKSDIPIAIRFCRRAASSSRRALYQLGRAYAAGGQLSEAAATYRNAAGKGSTAAMIALGSLFATGSGVPADTAQARALFERAAAAGNPRAATALASLANVNGALADPAQQRALLTAAAAENSADAEFQLGVMYAEGTGGPKDDVAARAMFAKAAAQNQPDALDWLGNFEESGRGGPADKAAAKASYQRAAALGNENAKAALKRLDCPFTVKDKRGNFVANLCF